MEPIRLTPCGADDLEMLRELSISTFRDAFESQNDPEDFRRYLETAFSPRQLRAEWEHPHTRFYFAWSGDRLAGYCKLNTDSAQTELQEPGGLEIERIYVTTAFQGRGMGSRMLEEITNLARGAGKRYVWLGVWQKNPGAIRFYERHGFTIFGEHPYYIGSDRQMDWMMRCELDVPAPCNPTKNSNS